MKHLFRLALKYVTRQKLRTALMFLSVTLSVFVLNTFLVYTSSTIRSVRNGVIAQNGEWEANLQGVLEAVRAGESETVKSPIEAAKIISNHVAVDKNNTYIFDEYQFPYEQNVGAPIGYFDIRLDDGIHRVVTSIFRSSVTGDLEMRNTFLQHTDDLAPDEMIVPSWFAKSGYDVGDTITITITPTTGMLEEHSEAMKAVRIRLAELNESSEDFYYILEGEEVDQVLRNNRRTIMCNLFEMLVECADIDDIKLDGTEMSTPVKVTGRIAGFDSGLEGESGICIGTALDTDIDLSPLNDSPFGFIRDNFGNCWVKTNPNTPFEYNIELLLKDLGFTDDDAYDDFKFAMHGYGMELNTPYMLTSFRSIEGMGTAVPYIGAYLVLLVIVWLFSRFIIDNAFEISVQERSVQFAALRIMGASKGQLATLVFTEGLFYALTALPLGIVSSTLACKYFFDSLAGVGVEYVEFYASPLTILICTLLCLTGVFISTYTSAMWASRKLSPAEALNYGKPKSPKKRKKQKKSKLDLGSKRFMIRYTFKNIFRTKRRFVISSVAMALGVLIFTLCIQLGLTLYGEVKDYIGEPTSDFYIYADAADADSIQKELMDSGNFKSSYYECHGSIVLTEKELKKLGDEIAALEGNMQGDFIPMSIMTMDKNEFESGHKGLSDMAVPYDERDITTYSELLGMSYEEFEKGDAVLFLPQQRYDGGEDFGYGYTKLPDHIVFNGNQDEEIRIRGIAHADYSTFILVPMSKAQELIKYGKSMSANMYFLVRDAEHYPAAKTAIDSMNFSVDNVYDEYKVNTGMTEFVNTIVKIVLTLMLSIWLCGIVSMMNTINTSALNRSRELIMMRAVGMTRKQLTGTVVLESLLFSSVSAIAGTLISIVGYQLIMRFILNFNATASGAAALVASLILNIVIAFLAALPAIRTLNHSVSK